MDNQTQKSNTSKINDTHANEKLDFAKFNQHSIWNSLEKCQLETSSYNETLIKSEVEGLILADSYAQIIADTWRQTDLNGEFDDREPCYLLELQANSGQFSCWVLNKLKKVLTNAEWLHYNPKYLVSDNRAERASECWRHPDLAYWIELGTIEPIQFDTCNQHYLNLKSQKLILGKNSLANPLIVIANGVFSNMRQSFYQIHYGKCFSSHIAFDYTNAEPETTSYTTHYDWFEVTDLESEHRLLPRYLERFDSSLVLIPFEALKVIDTIKQLSINGCLILSSDRGFHSELDLREQGLPEFSPSSKYFLPLNGHALSWATEMQNGQAVHEQKSKDGPLHSILWYPQKGSKNNIQPMNLSRHLQHNNGDIAGKMTQLSLLSQETITSDQLLSLIELTQYDHNVLFAHYQCIFKALPALTPHQRKRWAMTLKKIWQRYYKFSEDTVFLQDFGVLAMQLNVWQVAKEIFIFLVDQFPNNEENLFHLASIYLQLGQRDEANRAAKMAIALAPENQQLINLSRELHAWSETCGSDLCYNQNLAVDGELSLHPLANHHAEHFLYQYRDPSIAVMTSLPSLLTKAEFNLWLDQQNLNHSKRVYAVVHRAWGFIGVVGLETQGNDTFFYFWIGSDYQNRGFGIAAAKLLLEMILKTTSVKRVYTCVFEDNIRSSQALKVLGFQRQTWKALGTSSAYHFLVWPHQVDSLKAYQSLKLLLQSIGSEIELNDFSIKL